MKTKAQIVQELLDKKAITAEDAVILLQSDIQYIPYIPYHTTWAQYPHYWVNPYPITSPFYVSGLPGTTCQA